MIIIKKLPLKNSKKLLSKIEIHFGMYIIYQFQLIIPIFQFPKPLIPDIPSDLQQIFNTFWKIQKQNQLMNIYLQQA